MKLPALLLFPALLTSCLAQSVPAPAPTTDREKFKAYRAQLENALAPALAAQKNHDLEGAYKLFQQVLRDYPGDTSVIIRTANAAKAAGHAEEALPLYESTIKNDHNYGNLYLPTVIQLYASLGRWEEFDAARKKAREASMAGDKALDPGYTIEDFTDGTRRIQVLEFPKLYGRFHTRYRFLFLGDLPFDPNTHFTPYVDLESDDIDQVSFKAQHPDKAAAGDRAYSLDSYPTPTSQALMRFFDGEPTYEEVRALVLGAPKPPKATTTLGPPSIPLPTVP